MTCPDCKKKVCAFSLGNGDCSMTIDKITGHIVMQCHGHSKPTSRCKDYGLGMIHTSPCEHEVKPTAPKQECVECPADLSCVHTTKEPVKVVSLKPPCARCGGTRKIYGKLDTDIYHVCPDCSTPSEDWEKECDSDGKLDFLGATPADKEYFKSFIRQVESRARKEGLVDGARMVVGALEDAVLNSPYTESIKQHENDVAAAQAQLKKIEEGEV